ncbi:MAG: hypothetical protein COT91_01235 [Candidatus Doudnabacteria bacterium CG10_big_fil_rev_8_21_14_0_10_41_10]|uniref:6-phosphogluconate dehydrogenase NADP-binding domain-containing protein n=1 Tax=Candidatus Doudnabacteria bacterium CG10_big_fil_rev_8_21_14_0_10_41_10 TaxID=1974551 RepID=A0A2H0VEH4_9BACT|nr:MAG: hypothetical protein COT91_01235 [Candidatus Doudnabacteria bacterium CG10_big_fil_rev_8_21_14_0_10_41_10]
MSKSQIGVIGLGKMGMQIARRLHKKGHRVYAWNRSVEPRKKFKEYTSRLRSKNKSGVAGSVPELVSGLKKPMIVWTMLPAGKPTADVMKVLLKNLSQGDIVIDGANENYQNTQKRAKIFAKKSIAFFDAGTSGGVHGEKNGFSIMVGGPKKLWKKVRPIFADLAAGDSYGLVGESGSG